MVLANRSARMESEGTCGLRIHSSTASRPAAVIS